MSCPVARVTRSISACDDQAIALKVMSSTIATVRLLPQRDGLGSRRRSGAERVDCTEYLVGLWDDCRMSSPRLSTKQARDFQLLKAFSVTIVNHTPRSQDDDPRREREQRCFVGRKNQGVITRSLL